MTKVILQFPIDYKHENCPHKFLIIIFCSYYNSKPMFQVYTHAIQIRPREDEKSTFSVHQGNK